MIATPRTRQVSKTSIIYPESDGKPIADHSLQFSYISLIKTNLDVVYADNPNVFVAGDMLWYPLEGDNKAATAPDVMVVLDRPKHDRGSYKQWEEGDIPPHIVFEIWSPNNTKSEQDAKYAFYNRHGVEEYYAFDPFRVELDGWRRQSDQLIAIPDMMNWESPLSNVKFTLEDGTLKLYRPNGLPFLSFVELNQKWHRENEKRKLAEEIVQEDELPQSMASEDVSKIEGTIHQLQGLVNEAKARQIAEEQVEQAEELIRQLQEQLQKAQASE